MELSFIAAFLAVTLWLSFIAAFLAVTLWLFYDV